MTDQHPITPSRGLVEEWVVKLERHNDAEVFTEAARWGADQELEECCEWAAEQDRGLDLELRAARRPKPKSLAEEALSALSVLTQADEELTESEWPSRAEVIRRALERLQELEGQGDG